MDQTPLWKRVEQRVARLTKGKITPGSGNGKQKGDVRLWREGLLIEAKSTIKTKITLQMDWFYTLENYSDESFPILYVFVQNEGAIYTPEFLTFDIEPSTWKTQTVTFQNLPESIPTHKFNWCLQPEEYLTELT